MMPTRARIRLRRLLGEPFALEKLKHRPGRRLTLRATGPAGSAIVKLYASGRAPTVAARIRALAPGPPEPILPKVLLVEPEVGMLVLSDLPGEPLRSAVLDGDEPLCGRAGAALGAWHSAWARRRPPSVLTPHTTGRELELLRLRARAAPEALSRAVSSLTESLESPWDCRTVVHRDLYEEQLLLGDSVALIDLDDAALGPAELDVGNLLAHLDLLAIRADRSFRAAIAALLAGYAAEAGQLDEALLDRCRRLSLLRLACIHREPALVEAAQLPRGRHPASGHGRLSSSAAGSG